MLCRQFLDKPKTFKLKKKPMIYIISIFEIKICKEYNYIKRRDKHASLAYEATKKQIIL